jgi:hypothetical protein
VQPSPSALCHPQPSPYAVRKLFVTLYTTFFQSIEAHPSAQPAQSHRHASGDSTVPITPATVAVRTEKVLGEQDVQVKIESFGSDLPIITCESCHGQGPQWSGETHLDRPLCIGRLTLCEL